MPCAYLMGVCLGPREGLDVFGGVGEKCSLFLLGVEPRLLSRQARSVVIPTELCRLLRQMSTAKFVPAETKKLISLRETRNC